MTSVSGKKNNVGVVCINDDDSADVSNDPVNASRNFIEQFLTTIAGKVGRINVAFSKDDNDTYIAASDEVLPFSLVKVVYDSRVYTDDESVQEVIDWLTGLVRESTNESFKNQFSRVLIETQMAEESEAHDETAGVRFAWDLIDGEFIPTHDGILKEEAQPGWDLSTSPDMVHIPT